MYQRNGYSGGRIPPVYIYIGVGVLAVVALWFVSGFIRAGVEGYFTLAVGALLLLGNVRELVLPSYAGRGNLPLLNSLLGGSLVMYFLGRGGFPPLGSVWYIIAVALALLAAPLMIGRAAVYTAYLGAARDAYGSVRRAVGTLIAR